MSDYLNKECLCYKKPISLCYSYLWQAVPSPKKQKEIKIGTFGSTTAQAVRDAGLRLDLEAPTVQAPSMTAALDMFIKENNK